MENIIKKFNEKYSDLNEFNLAGFLARIYKNKEQIDIELMKYIFQLDINFNAKTSSSGYSAFMISLALNNLELTQLFIDKGIDVNETIFYHADKEEYDMSGLEEIGIPFVSRFEIHPMNFLLLEYNSEHIKLLINAGININARTYDLSWIKTGQEGFSESLLNSAISNNDLEITQLLLSKNAVLHVNIDFVDLLKNGYFEMIKLLIDNGINEPIVTGISVDTIKVEKNGIFDKYNLLEICAIESVANPFNSNENAEAYFELAEYLIKKGADVNYGSPLWHSLNAKDRLSGIDIGHFNSSSPSIKYNVINKRMVYLLLENGANVNYQDANGKSILMSACEPKRLNAYMEESNILKFNIVKLLIEKGANINHLDNKLNNVFHYLGDDSTELETYVDVEGKKLPQLKIFETSPSEMIMKLLIDNGADINATNNIGFTPLMKYALNGDVEIAKILLEKGANINIKSEVTAFDLACNEVIKNMIADSKNHSPQKLVKLLTNFTIDKPIKYTTHTWDFGELKKEYGDFDGYMKAVRTQFDTMKSELEELSPNLYKKVYSFLIETNPSEDYTWCSKTNINIGWSSLDGLKEWCDSGKNPFDFKLPKPIMIPPRKHLSTFGDIINLFKQEIEVRADFNNLETIFKSQKIDIDLTSAKLSNRQFYTDTSKFTQAVDKIFAEIKKREELKDIDLSTKEYEDRSIEIKITQLDSISSRSADELLSRAKQSGDLADIVESLKNLCDYSVETSYEDTNFRVNFLHSNNVKDILELEEKPKGFTHILRFYK